MEGFNFTKISEVEVWEQHQIKISNRSAALENLIDSQEKNKAWVNIKQKIKISAKESLGLYEQKQHIPWLHKECPQILVG